MWGAISLGQTAPAGGAGGAETIVVSLLIILATAGVVSLVMHRMKLAFIPAYIITGAIVGPNALGFVASPESLESITRLAIILLMFGIGMQLPLSSLRHGLGPMLIAGFGSCIVSIILGWPVAMLFGLSAPAAMAVCMGLSTSSTAVIMRILAERRELGRTHGRMCFVVSACQDLLVLVMLASLPALAAWQGTTPGDAAPPEPLAFIRGTLINVAGLTLLIVLARIAIPRLMHEAAKTRSNEVIIVLSTAFAIGAAVAAQALGFSAELGAASAGLVLGATPFRHHLSAQINPLRDLFIAVFFVTLGMVLDPAILIRWWWLILLGAAVSATIKAVVIGFSCWAVGATGSIAVLVGVALAQSGEISLVLILAAKTQGVLTPTVAGNAIAIVVISLIAAPSLMSLGRWLATRSGWIGPAPWLKTSALRTEIDPEPLKSGEVGHVIIGGFGPVGRIMSEKLGEAGVHYTIIELNPETVRTQTKLGKEIIYGDTSSVEALESAGIRRADALILTVPDEEAVLRACEAARRIRPDIFIAARTNFLSKGMLASRMGADHVTIEELATAESMQKEVMHRLADRRRAAREEAKKDEPQGREGTEGEGEAH